ncbi:MAG: lytic transglycosylase domain-containing protein, partial [Acidobacteria bacterium]|nr:lytic transglycosylase domain-containing protein [Acidobacteriota bacterium]
MKRSVAFVLALASLASLGTSQDAEANVRLTRRGDGRVVIFNDIGSGWRVAGRAPSDSFLIARKSVATPFDETIHTCSRAHGIDPGLVKSVMLIESNFNPRAVSRKGARGLMQLMPATARRFGVTNAFDPHENIRGGTAYLAWLLGNFNGNVHLALAGYNAGEGAVARYGGVPPYAETQEYVRRGMLVYSGSGSSGA